MKNAAAKFYNPTTQQWEPFGNIKYIEVDKAAATVHEGLKQIQTVEGWPGPLHFQLVENTNREEVIYDSIKNRINTKQ